MRALTPVSPCVAVLRPGVCKTIEFAFDMGEDTAECIANEMMEDLSLSAAEAQDIAAKIREEIARTQERQRSETPRSLSLQPAAQPSAASPPALLPSSSVDAPASPGPRQELASPGRPASTGEVAQPPASPSAAGLPGSGPNGLAPGPSLSKLSSMRRSVEGSAGKPPLPAAAGSGCPAAAGASGADAWRASVTGMANGRSTNLSGYHTPAGEEPPGSGSLKGVSIHELIAAMRHAQEEVALEAQQQQQQPPRKNGYHI
jgi:hypothetical protein